MTKGFPLGRWVHQQRKALRAGELDPHRRELLEEAGMVWEPGDEAWETKLATVRSYRRATGHLAPAGRGLGRGCGKGAGRTAHGQPSSQGRPGEGHEAAEERAEQLAAIDRDWNCPWPLDWQRHYRVLADLVDADGVLPVIEPVVMFEGDDLGKWLQRQKDPGTGRSCPPSSRNG